MITEDYVSFETAKLLKEKGFNEPCLMCYTYEEKLGNYGHYESCKNSDVFSLTAPTLQMAMKWLRKEKNWYIQVSIQNDGTYMGYIYRTDGFPYIGWDKRRVKETPEEACEAAIKYCLENLI